MTEEVEFQQDEMREIIDDFLVEADELVASLDANLVTLESRADDLDLLNEIFRAAHTIKGTSSFLGFEQVTNLTHKMEDVLNKLRKAELKVTPEIMDVLLQSVDILKELLNNVREQNGQEVDLTAIIARLIAVQEAGGAPAPDTTVETVTVEPNSATEAPSDFSGPGATAPAAGAKIPTAQAGSKKGGDQTIRVDVNRLDSLMNLMGELVLGRNSLVQTVNLLNKDGQEVVDAKERLNRNAASINYITTELQLAVMKMRMQPIGKVFAKFPRLVRDLARDLNKEIDLIMEGESTELDKSVIEEIGDPLVHIIRNSCDHGIESPDDRAAKGKPRKGTVKISAKQEGSSIVIEVKDDGKGLDPTVLRAKAVERGMTTSEAAERLSDKAVFRFLFAAGFSTAKVVSDVSGRGVGMDVVRTNIEKLNGLVELDSVKGAGTTISIKLPLTLAIIQGLLVESDDEVFILPLSSVHETVRTEQANIYYVNQKPVLRLRDEIIPIVNLGSVLRNDRRGFVLTEKPYVVIVGLADRKLGINIDRFLGQEEVVIKSLGRYLGSTAGVAGATILGDGRIRLIVDLLGLFQIAGKLA